MQQDKDYLQDPSAITADPSFNGSADYVKLDNASKSSSVALLKTLSMNHIKSEYSSEQTVIASNKQLSDMESQRGGTNKQKVNPLQRSKSASRRENLLRDYQSSRDGFSDSGNFRDDEVYIVKQEIGYLSYAFSAIQTLILIIMMMQCTIAPIEINPMIGPPPDALDYWGGKNALKILKNGEEWRLITPIFLHAGIIHLLCNVSVQLDIGAFFEREWGGAIWLFIYLASALGSSIFSVCMKPNNVSVGSSGAVMGLFGGKLGEIFCRACESKKTSQGRIGHEVRREQLGAVLCSVFVVLAFSFVPYVDWAAHLGGLIAGFAAAFLCFAPKIKTKTYAIFWSVVGIVMNVSLYVASIKYMINNVQPNEDLNDVCAYYKQYFDGYECQCQLE